MELGAPVRSSVKPFTKIEKMTTKKYKPPRLIQARDLTFNIEYGKYIKPIEEHLFKRHRARKHFGKGNYDEIAKRIKKFTKHYTHYTELDHDSFDAHITTQLLALTHKFYQSCYNHNSELRNLSKKTLYNRCKTRQGDKWKCKGTRMSGDVDTSLGNSLINYAILMELLHQLNIKGDAIVNGDDSIIFTNEPIDIERAQQILRTMNMESKMKPTVTNIHKVDFCQTRLVYRSDGTPTMMMDPTRVYSKFGMTPLQLKPNQYRQYLYELALCLGLTHSNTPMGAYWLRLINAPIRKRPIVKPLKYIEQSIFQLVEREKLSGVSDETFTDSMIQAYPDCLDITEKISKIRIRLKSTRYHIIINHDIKTIKYQYIKTIKGNQPKVKKDIILNQFMNIQYNPIIRIATDPISKFRGKTLIFNEQRLLHRYDDDDAIPMENEID